MTISVITVCRNASATIERTLESVLQQHREGAAVELIVVDGASTDGTVEMVRRYKGKLPLRWVSEPDGGIYEAMNKGIEMARGELIAILNADDWYLSGALLRVLERFNKEQLDYLYGTVERWREGEKVGLNRPLERSLWEREIWWQMPIPHVSLVAKRSLYQQVGLFDSSYRIGGDHDWMVRLYKSGAKGGELAEPAVAAVELGGIGGGWGRFPELYRCAVAHGQPRWRVRKKLVGYLIKQGVVRWTPNRIVDRLLQKRSGRYR